MPNLDLQESIKEHSRKPRQMLGVLPAVHSLMAVTVNQNLVEFSWVITANLTREFIHDIEPI